MRIGHTLQARPSKPIWGNPERPLVGTAAVGGPPSASTYLSMKIKPFLGNQALTNSHKANSQSRHRNRKENDRQNRSGQYAGSEMGMRSHPKEI